MHSRLAVLFVGDPNLGEAGAKIVRRRLLDVTCLTWDRTARTPHGDFRTSIRTRTWDTAISFYNDFIFDRSDLACMRVPLNIHPALPCLRGVG